jgi:hypothetical protein
MQAIDRWLILAWLLAQKIENVSSALQVKLPGTSTGTHHSHMPLACKFRSSASQYTCMGEPGIAEVSVSSSAELRFVITLLLNWTRNTPYWLACAHHTLVHMALPSRSMPLTCAAGFSTGLSYCVSLQ